MCWCPDSEHPRFDSGCPAIVGHPTCNDNHVLYNVHTTDSGIAGVLFIRTCLGLYAATVHISDGRFRKKENYSIRFIALSEPPPLHSPHQGSKLLIIIVFAEASSDIDANVSHDAILQHSDARS